MVNEGLRCLLRFAVSNSIHDVTNKVGLAMHAYAHHGPLQMRAGGRHRNAAFACVLRNREAFEEIRREFGFRW